MAKSTKPWPRLSETLPLADVGKCQQCGSAEKLTAWHECNDNDRPAGPVFVVLCQACADRIIEPHPRLYKRLLTDEALPGALPMCADCVFRRRLRCTSPQAAFNGGDGIVFDPPPTQIHLHGRGISGWHWLMLTGEALQLAGGEQRCSGKQVAHG